MRKKKLHFGGEADMHDTHRRSHRRLMCRQLHYIKYLNVESVHTRVWKYGYPPLLAKYKQLIE